MMQYVRSRVADAHEVNLSTGRGQAVGHLAIQTSLQNAAHPRNFWRTLNVLGGPFAEEFSTCLVGYYEEVSPL